MDKGQLEAFRARLIAEKARVQAEIERRDQDSRENAEDQYEESTMGNGLHIADAASDVFEQERINAERDDATDRLNEINKALERIDNGTYGISEVSGKPIPVERLQALPWATRLVDEETEENIRDISY